MLPPIYPLLMGAPAVHALIADRAYRHGSAPQGVLRPYVTWAVPGGFAENAFDGAAADVFRLQVDCWADGDDGDAIVESLAGAVRAAIEPAAHLVAYIADERNFETRRYRIGMAFDFILAR